MTLSRGRTGYCYLAVSAEIHRNWFSQSDFYLSRKTKHFPPVTVNMTCDVDPRTWRIYGRDELSRQLSRPERSFRSKIIGRTRTRTNTRRAEGGSALPGRAGGTKRPVNIPFVVMSWAVSVCVTDAARRAAGAAPISCIISAPPPPLPPHGARRTVPASARSAQLRRPMSSRVQDIYPAPTPTPNITFADIRPCV